MAGIFATALCFVRVNEHGEVNMVDDPIWEDGPTWPDAKTAAFELRAAADALDPPHAGPYNWAGHLPTLRKLAESFDHPAHAAPRRYLLRLADSIEQRLCRPVPDDVIYRYLHDAEFHAAVELTARNLINPEQETP